MLADRYPPSWTSYTLKVLVVYPESGQDIFMTSADHDTDGLRRVMSTLSTAQVAG